MARERVEEVAVDICPWCNTSGLKVIDSRIRPNGSRIRRKECWECGYRFTTIEAQMKYIKTLEKQNKVLRELTK